jgi:hypothetical protein
MWVDGKGRAYSVSGSMGRVLPFPRLYLDGVFLIDLRSHQLGAQGFGSIYAPGGNNVIPLRQWHRNGPSRRVKVASSLGGGLVAETVHSQN